MKRTLTDAQRAVLRTSLAKYPSWVGAADHGQRVTFASLHSRGLMDRKRRDGKPDVAADRASCGYYYRPTKQLWADWMIRSKGTQQTGQLRQSVPVIY